MPRETGEPLNYDYEPEEYIPDPDEGGGVAGGAVLAEDSREQARELLDAGFNKTTAYCYDLQTYQENYPDLFSALDKSNRRASSRYHGLMEGRNIPRICKPLILIGDRKRPRRTYQAAQWTAACATLSYGYNVMWADFNQWVSVIGSPNLGDYTEMLQCLDDQNTMMFFNGVYAKHLLGSISPWHDDPLLRAKVRSCLADLTAKGANICLIGEADTQSEMEECWSKWWGESLTRKWTSQGVHNIGKPAVSTSDV